MPLKNAKPGFIKNRQDYKPGSVVSGHLSRPAVAGRLERSTWSRRAALCFDLTLLRMGFTWPPALPRER